MTNPDGSVQYDFSGEWEKRITPEFSIAIGDTFTHLNNPRANGWQNFETAFRYQLFTNAEHEFILTLGVGFEWGHTGNASVGAEPFTRWRPEIWFGKGFGDLPTSLNFLRPFAVTGNLGVSFPTEAIVVNDVTKDQFSNHIVSVTHNPTFFDWGLSLQYSLIYMNANVLELQPEFLRDLVPLVEVNFSTPIANTGPSVTGTPTHITTGTVNPGIIYVKRRYFEVGAEALIPVNSASGKHVGARVLLDFFLDDLFPDSIIGRPIFAPHSDQAVKSP